jgi:YegS/Rv2252/BmrU family lipid kinase
MTNKHRTLFILSVKAGNGKSLKLTRTIEEMYREAGQDVTILVTQHGTHAYESAKAFAAEHGEQGIVFICGGDGSTSEVANALANKNTAMGVLPLGTANDFSRMLYTKKEAADLTGLLRRTLHPTIRPIDLIHLNDRYSINITSFGFDTIVLEHAYEVMRELPFVGSAGYALGIVKSLFSRKKFGIEAVWTDEEGRTHRQVQKSMMLGALCNGGYYGNGFNPAPMAKTDDGILHVCLVDAMPFPQFLTMIRAYKKGTHINHPKIKMGNAVSGTFRPLKPDTSILGNIDGIIFNEPEIRFEAAPKALKFAFI